MWGGLFMILPCFHAIYITGTRFTLSLGCELAQVKTQNHSRKQGLPDSMFQVCHTSFRGGITSEWFLSRLYKHAENSVDTTYIFHVLVNSYIDEQLNHEELFSNIYNLRQKRYAFRYYI